LTEKRSKNEEQTISEVRSFKKFLIQHSIVRCYSFKYIQSINLALAGAGGQKSLCSSCLMDLAFYYFYSLL